MLNAFLFPVALAHAVAARAGRFIDRATAPAPVSTLAPTARQTVADLRRLAARAGLPRALYTYGRRADLLAALATV